MAAFIKKFLKSKVSIQVLQSLGIVISFTLLSSCATLDLTLPISELESPQHQGRKLGIGVDFTALTSKQLTLTDDPSARPPNIDLTKHKTGNLFLTKTGLNYYFLDRFALSGILIDSKIPAMKLKIAILHGFREDAQPGTYHASFNMMGSYQQAENLGNQNGVGGSVGFPWKGTASLMSGTVGLSFGYQFFGKTIPFIGVNYQQFQTKGEINQTATTTDSGGVYKINLRDGKIITYGLGVDYRPNPRFFIMPQVYMYNFKWYENDYNEIGGSVKLIYVPVQ